jgi:hypothetical protein
MPKLKVVIYVLRIGKENDAMNKKRKIGNLILVGIILLSACSVTNSQNTSNNASVTPTEIIKTNEPAPTLTDTPVPTLTLTPTQIPEQLSGEVETQDFMLPVDHRVQIVDDLIITASGEIDIAGELVAESSMNVTIQAVGNISIAGKILMGMSPEGENGGSLTIISEQGNIVLQQTAKLGSGDGGDGVTHTELDGEMVTIIGGQGGQGGTLMLQALQGELRIPFVPEILHVGNGGEGAAISIQGEDLLTTQIEDQLKNGGGSSGGLVLMAETVSGAEFEAITLSAEENINWSGADLPMGSILYFPTDEVLISGGRAGNAGALNYGMDAEGNSTWPALEPVASTLDADSWNRYWPQANILASAASSILTELLQPDDDVKYKVVSGVSGSDGLWGSDGTAVHYSGKRALISGDKGVSVKGIGGSGGDGFFTGGDGGHTYVRGGDGGAGGTPGSRGGDGGDAVAIGGKNGYGRSSVGREGNATARGGNGGKGGGDCPSNVSWLGGDGGTGGKAMSYVKVSIQKDGKIIPILPVGPGIFKSIGGNGGNGGDGQNGAGEAGSGGKGIMTMADSHGTAYSGDDGKNGATCPPPPKSCNCEEAIFKIESYDGNKSWSDCGEKSACKSIIGAKEVESGTVITSKGGSCSMKMYCK